MNTTIHPSQIPRVRRWHGKPLNIAEEMLMFHKDAGPVPDTLRRLRTTLEKEGIGYVVIGGFALGVHGYRRDTNDVDVCMRPQDFERFQERLVGTVYQKVEGPPRRFFDPETEATFDVLISGAFAGRTSRNKFIRFPDPSEAVIIEDLPTVPLERLIELKLVTWRSRDFPDVVELIRRNNLGEDFADRLHPLVRMAYLECYDIKAEEDKYQDEP